MSDGSAWGMLGQWLAEPENRGVAWFGIGIAVVAGGHQSCMWPSVIAVCILGGLAVWQWRMSYSTEK